MCVTGILLVFTVVATIFRMHIIRFTRDISFGYTRHTKVPAMINPRRLQSEGATLSIDKDSYMVGDDIGVRYDGTAFPQLYGGIIQLDTCGDKDKRTSISHVLVNEPSGSVTFLSTESLVGNTIPAGSHQFIYWAFTSQSIAHKIASTPCFSIVAAPTSSPTSQPTNQPTVSAPPTPQPTGRPTLAVVNQTHQVLGSVSQQLGAGSRAGRDDDTEPATRRSPLENSVHVVLTTILIALSTILGGILISLPIVLAWWLFYGMLTRYTQSEEAKREAEELSPPPGVPTPTEPDNEEMDFDDILRRLEDLP